jgi:hypothetical protein
MKKTTSVLKRGLFAGVSGLFVVCMLLSCGSKENNSATAETATEEASESANCLNGKWTVMADNVEKSFTFNDDHTGQEVNTPDDIRQFKWEQKDSKQVAILYAEDPSNKEWTLNLDCDAGTLSFFGLAFKK